MKEAAQQGSTEALAARLLAVGIQPSAQRLSVARYVLFTDEHPSAEEVLARLESEAEEGRGLSMISRATVYNTLNLFVDKGLLRQFLVSEGHTVFDPRLEPHHHFLDVESGKIVDLPWEALPLDLSGLPTNGALQDFDVEDVQVVLRGKRRKETGKHKLPQ